MNFHFELCFHEENVFLILFNAHITTDWELPLLVISLKGSIYYFANHNIWYKYTGITKQKDKYLMADKKLRIQRKLKIELHKHH
jgi:hypothetical protein